jgi:hypothetical protein
MLLPLVILIIAFVLGAFLGLLNPAVVSLIVLALIVAVGLVLLDDRPY